MTDKDIDFSENPILGEDFWAEAVRWPGPKKQITLRVDPDVLDFFRKQGRGYQTTINSVLRQYVDAQRRSQGQVRKSLKEAQNLPGDGTGMTTPR